MIFSEKLIDEIKLLNSLDSEAFEKSVNYSISILTKEEASQFKLHEILDIDEEESTKILNGSSKIILLLCKDKFNSRDYKSMIEMCFLDKIKKEILNNKIEQSYELIRKNLNNLDIDPIPKFKHLEWRYDIQVASRSFEEELKPKIFLKLQLTKNLKDQNLLIESDYANLKNLYEELNNALKLHESNKQKKIRKLFF